MARNTLEQFDDLLKGLDTPHGYVHQLSVDLDKKSTSDKLGVRSDAVGDAKFEICGGVDNPKTLK